MITRRCTQRQYLMRPDEATNNAFEYCVLEAAERFDIDIILPSAQSNHHHTNVFDRHGRVVEFYEHFHKMYARSQNALRGRSENFWSSEEVSLVELTDVEAAIDAVVYSATNPVKDGLVERVQDWPGVNGLDALLTGKPIETTRPRHFFRADGPMPERVSRALVIPPELGDPDEFRRRVREGVAAAEKRFAEQRAREGRPVMGRKAILRQSWRAAPSSPAPRRGLRPRVAAGSAAARVEALGRNRLFEVLYRQARALWLKGAQVLFPAGTYWLRRFANVTVAQVS